MPRWTRNRHFKELKIKEGVHVCHMFNKRDYSFISTDNFANQNERRRERENKGKEGDGKR